MTLESIYPEAKGQNGDNGEFIYIDLTLEC